MSPKGEPFRNTRNYSNTRRKLIPQEDWSRLDQVSIGYRSTRWFSLPLSRVLLAPSVGGERGYGRSLAWKLVRGRDQEAPG